MTAGVLAEVPLDAIHVVQGEGDAPGGGRFCRLDRRLRRVEQGAGHQHEQRDGKNHQLSLHGGLLEDLRSVGVGR